MYDILFDMVSDLGPVIAFIAIIIFAIIIFTVLYYIYRYICYKVSGKSDRSSYSSQVLWENNLNSYMFI